MRHIVLNYNNKTTPNLKESTMTDTRPTITDDQKDSILKAIDKSRFLTSFETSKHIRFEGSSASTLKATLYDGCRIDFTALHAPFTSFNHHPKFNLIVHVDAMAIGEDPEEFWFFYDKTMDFEDMIRVIENFNGKDFDITFLNA